MIPWPDVYLLIKTLSRIRLRSADTAYLSSFLRKPDIPWKTVVRVAEMQGVAGLMYYHLGRFRAFQSAYGSAFRRLKAMYQQIREENITCLSDAERISEHLEASESSAMVLQGLSVLKRYRYPGLRPMGDMDILVRPEDRACVIVELHHCGFRVSNPVYPNIFYNGRSWLDLHTHVLNLDRIEAREYLFPKELSALWSRAKPFFRNSRGLLRPDSYDAVILQAAHALKHGYSRMIWLVDLNEMLASLICSGKDWQRLIERSRFWHQQKVVLYALIILEGTLDMVLPAWVKSALGGRKLKGIEKHLLRLKINGFSSSEYCMALWMFAIRGFPNRLRFLYETLFPRPEVMDQIYIRSRRRPSRMVRVNRALKAAGLLRRNLQRVARFSFRPRQD